jgi:hypothetical protein
MLGIAFIVIEMAPGSVSHLRGDVNEPAFDCVDQGKMREVDCRGL